jgi:hypothetical protein
MHPRPARRFDHRGFLKIGEEVYPCQMSNMSASGATITFDGPIDVPEAFSIFLTPDDKVARACSVVWRQGTDIGVAFIRKDLMASA